MNSSLSGPSKRKLWCVPGLRAAAPGPTHRRPPARLTRGRTCPRLILRWPSAESRPCPAVASCPFLSVRPGLARSPAGSRQPWLPGPLLAVRLQPPPPARGSQFDCSRGGGSERDRGPAAAPSSSWAGGARRPPALASRPQPADDDCPGQHSECLPGVSPLSRW